MTHLESDILVIGAGPVGLTIAIDLAMRGIDVTVLEIRRAGEPPNVKCNQVSARSMEIFRRLNLADTIRRSGLPREYRNDVSCTISATGIELARITLPSSAGRMRGEKGDDSWWPTAEFPHRINQLFLEPLLFSHAAAQPNIRILNRSQFEEFSQNDASVTALARNLDSGKRMAITSRYLVGCNGGRSTVRRGISAEFVGMRTYDEVRRMSVIGHKRVPVIRSPRRCELAPLEGPQPRASAPYED